MRLQLCVSRVCELCAPSFGVIRRQGCNESGIKNDRTQESMYSERTNPPNQRHHKFRNKPQFRTVILFFLSLVYVLFFFFAKSDYIVFCVVKRLVVLLIVLWINNQKRQGVVPLQGPVFLSRPKTSVARGVPKGER